MKRPVKGWEEQNALTPWREVYCKFQRPGVAARVKRTYRRRERHNAKRDVQRERHKNDTTD